MSLSRAAAKTCTFSQAFNSTLRKQCLYINTRSQCQHLSYSTESDQQEKERDTIYRKFLNYFTSESAKKTQKDYSNPVERPMQPKSMESLFIPFELRCGLTNTLFVKPVKLPNGNLYSKNALRLHVLEHGFVDPTTHEPILPDQMSQQQQQNWINKLPIHEPTQKRVSDFIRLNSERLQKALSHHYKFILDTYEDSSERNLDNLFALSECYMHGAGVPKDVKRGVSLLRKAAEKGHEDAQISLGKLLNNTDDKKSYHYFKRAADEHNNAYAQYRVGLAHLVGKGVDEVDLDMALQFFTLSAEQGEAGGFWGLGACIMRGIGIEKDVGQAYQLFVRAAEKGLDRAQFMVGLFLREGTHVPRNPQEAYDWFTKAAQGGHVQSMIAAGTMVMNNELENFEEDTAVLWFKKAAQHKDPKGFYNLALCFESGHGVDRDMKLAKFCMERAAEMGLFEAEEALKQPEKFDTSKDSEETRTNAASDAGSVPGSQQ